MGVHDHIFTDYPEADIRMFAVLSRERFTADRGCDVTSISRLLKNTGFSIVGTTVFELNDENCPRIGEVSEEVKAALDRVALGTIAGEGEGIVLYVYDPRDGVAHPGGGGAGGARGIFKYKNLQYVVVLGRYAVCIVCVRRGVALWSSLDCCWHIWWVKWRA